MYETVIDGTSVKLEFVEGGVLTTSRSPFEPHNIIRKFIKTANIPPHIFKLLEKESSPKSVPEPMNTAIEEIDYDLSSGKSKKRR